MRPAASSRRRAPDGWLTSRTANPTAPNPRTAAGDSTDPTRRPRSAQPSERGRRHFERDLIHMADDMSMSPSRDDFAALLDETLAGRDLAEGAVVNGRVV